MKFSHLNGFSKFFGVPGATLLKVCTNISVLEGTYKILSVSD